MLKLTQPFIGSICKIALILFVGSVAAYAADDGSITWINNPTNCSPIHPVLYSHPAIHRCGLHTKAEKPLIPMLIIPLTT